MHSTEPTDSRQPLVSICIPAYKAEKYLQETLDSIRGQTHGNWELIVTEDGSKDRCEEIVAKFAGEVRQRVIYQRHPTNKGLSTTRNTGFAAATGDYIAILDADDLWLADHLELSVRNLEAGADLSYSACINFDSDTGREMETRALGAAAISAFPLSLLDHRLVIQPSTVVFRKNILDLAKGFNPAYPICNDLEFWLSCARLGLRFSATYKVTCRYRKHPTALSRNAAALAAEVAGLHRQFRHWPGLPSGIRRRLALRAHWSATRMLARKKPLRACSLVLKGLADYLLPRT